MSTKYNVIVKKGNKANRSADTIRYHNVTDLLRLTKYLDSNYPNWTWFNVYDCITRKQLTSYTKYRRPQSRQL